MKWIKTEDQIPINLDRYYLIYESKERIDLKFDVCSIHKDPDDNVCDWYDGDGCPRHPEYWMELPEKPKV